MLDIATFPISDGRPRGRSPTSGAWSAEVAVAGATPLDAPAARGGGGASARVRALGGAWGASPSATWGGGVWGEGQGGAGVAHQRQALGARRWRSKARLRSLVHPAAPSAPLPLAHPMRGRRCSRRLALSSAWRGALAPSRHLGAHSGRWSAPARSPVACAPVQVLHPQSARSRVHPYVAQVSAV